MKTTLAKASAVELLTIVRPGDQLDAAGRINYFHRLSRQAGEVAIRAALFAGMELFREKISRLGTFNQWVEQNCDFSGRTAYRYLSLVQQSIGSERDLKELSDQSAAARQETVEAFASKVESKSLTELMCDYGIITRSKSNLGGKREGAGRPRKQSAEELAEQADAISNALNADATNNCVNQLYTLGILQGGLGEMCDEVLKGAVSTLETVLQKAKEILKSRR